MFSTGAIPCNRFNTHDHGCILFEYRMANVKFVIIAVLLSGCTTYNTTSISIDNSAKNNFVGNPCGFYVNDHCLYIKKNYRNPENPYKKEEWIK